MKNKFILAASIAAISLTFACKNKSEQIKENSGALKDLPAWVLDPAVKDGVAGVGIASPSKGGIKFQIPKAELDAKGNIASTIQSEISRISKDAMRSAAVNGNDDVEEFFAQATKEVVKNLPLAGVKRINIFKAEDGTLYVHMLLSNDDYSKFLADSQKSFQSRLAKSGMARDNINKTQEANKELFAELEKERDKKAEANDKTAE